MTDAEIMELAKLAEGGDTYAQNSLGATLAQVGGEANERAALYWYLEAVEQGFIESMWNAGTMLVNGEGSQANQRFGMLLITTAATAGNSSACLFLSNCYRLGLQGYAKNPDLAQEWQNKAWADIDDSDFVTPIAVSEHLDNRPPRPAIPEQPNDGL